MSPVYISCIPLRNRVKLHGYFSPHSCQSGSIKYSGVICCVFICCFVRCIVSLADDISWRTRIICTHRFKYSCNNCNLFLFIVVSIIFLHCKIFTKIHFLDHWVTDDFGTGAVFKNFTIVQYITAVGNTQCFTDVMVGDNHAQTTIFKL